MGDRVKSLETVINDGYQVKIEAYLRKGWNIFQKDSLGFIGFTLILQLISLVFLKRVPKQSYLFISMIYIFLSPGMYIPAFKILKKQKHDFFDFFKFFNYIIPLTLANSISCILIGLGLLLLLAPGIYLLVAYAFVIPIILDRRIDFWQAMEASRKIANQQWFSLLGLALTIIVISLIGNLLKIGSIVTGELITLPLATCLMVAAYDDIIGVKNTEF